MRLRRMKLVHFRGVREREILLTDGVTIVEGPNEVGKSSFQDALDLLFRRKAQASASEVLDAVPYGQDVGPEIEVELETGPYALVFRKRYRKRPETQLQLLRPKPERLAGDEAHERAKAILGETLDLNLWERLRLRQHEQLQPAPVGNTPALMNRLDDLSGDADQRVAEAGVLSGAEREYKRYFSPARGDEAGELKTARQQADEAQQAFDAATQTLQELDEQVDNYERLQREVTGVEARLVDAKADAAKRNQDLKAFESVSHRVSQAQTAHARAETEQTKALGLVEARAALREKAAETAKSLAHAEQQHAAIAASFATLRSAHEEAEQALRSATRAEQQAQADLTAVRRRVGLIEARDQHAKLQRRVGRIDELQHQRQLAEAAVGANPVDEALIAKVRKADQARREAAAALQAGAPAIALDALANLQVSIDGDSVALRPGEHRDFTVSEALRLEVPGVLRLSARPGSSLASLQSSRDRAEGRVAQLLRQCEVEDVEDAERRARARREAQATAAGATAEMKALLGADELDDLRAQLASLRVRLDELSATVDSDRLMDPSAAEQALARSEDRYRQDLERLQAAQATLNGLSEPYGQEKERLRQAVEALSSARDNDRNAVAALTEARAKAADEALADTLARAEASLNEALQGLQKEQRVLAAFDGESIRRLADNSRQVAADLQLRLNGLREAYAGARTLVEAGREKGLFEQAQAAEDRLKGCLTRLHQTQARANGARRLREVLQRCRQQAYERHRAPFRERVEKLARLAFGTNLEVELADDLQIVRRTMNGVTLEFHQLSGGAQEQLGLASRLAAAMLLGDEGGPLLLDDTLGHSDPDRLRGLGAMIGAAAEQAQVVIFTCQPDRFSHVGGARILRL